MTRRIVRSSTQLAFAAIIAACGGSTTGSGSSTSSSSGSNGLDPTDTGSDARDQDQDGGAPDDAGKRFACGTRSCLASDVCVEGRCVDPAEPLSMSSTGGPARTCGPADCDCISARLMGTGCAGSQCTLNDGHAFATCAPW